MCGIVGYAGDAPAAQILLDGLSRLEYRGYDSAGVCVLNNAVLEVEKTKGKLSNLYKKLDGGKNIAGTTGIGHTRWATHGAPSDENSHPHKSANGKIALVHNGVIENYMALKEKLIRLGKSFSSQTDSEAAANLIEYYYENGYDFPAAVRQAQARLEGSYALGILCADVPGTVIAVKKDSPLIFGFGENENFIASDIPAILKYTRRVCRLEDSEMAIFTKNKVRFLNSAGDVIEKTPELITWEPDAAEKGGYEHFMLKEIHEQPKAVKDTLSPRIKNGDIVFEGVSLTPEYLKGLQSIYIVACGSAYYVGCVGKYVLEKLCGIHTETVPASEFRYSAPVLNKNTLVLIISQSGETADSLAALRKAKECGARTLAFVNVVGSAISREADDTVYTLAGPEIAVATTKAYSAQLACVYLLALYIARHSEKLPAEQFSALLEQLLLLPSQIESLLTEDSIKPIQYLASKYFTARDIYFIGRNTDSAAALEGCLKLKEIAYIHSEAAPAGELKHGPIALIEHSTPVIALASVGEVFEKTVSNIKEVAARGAEIVILTTEEHRKEAEELSANIILVPKTCPLFQPSLSVIPLQLFAYYTAVLRGCDVDMPRNLAKSVTVE